MSPDQLPGDEPWAWRMEARVGRLEQDMSEIKDTLRRLEPMIARTEAILQQTIPTLATKAEVERLSEAIPNLATKAEVQKLTEAIPTLATKAEFELLKQAIPNLATKLELKQLRTEQERLRGEMLAALADKPSKLYLWGIVGVVVTSFGCGLAGLAVLK